MRFHEHGGAELDSVRPQILSSWARSRSSGIDPEGLGIHQADVDLETEFLRAGSRVLLGMSDVLDGTHTSLALTDSAGTMTWRWEAEPSLGRLFDDTEIHVGSAMAEGAAGTNGIAVALAERRPATVVGAEHFKQPWHGWACAAAPVVHPVSGHVAGAVNIACRTRDANHLMLVVLRSLVNGVRTALADGAGARERRLMDAHVRLRALADGPVVTLDAHDLIAGDDVAELGLDRAELWAMIHDAGAHRGELPIGPGHVGRAYPIAEEHPDDGYVVVIHRRPGGAAGVGGGTGSPPLTPLQDAERRVIADSLRRHGHNKSEAAQHLGISRGTLYERLRRYDLS